MCIGPFGVARYAFMNVVYQADDQIRFVISNADLNPILVIWDVIYASIIFPTDCIHTLEYDKEDIACLFPCNSIRIVVLLQ